MSTIDEEKKARLVDIAMTAIEKVSVASEEYGDRYRTNDIARELDEEAIDLVGWMMMAALRCRDVMEQRFSLQDKRYWDQLLLGLHAQNPEHLRTLIENAQSVLDQKLDEETALD